MKQEVIKELSTAEIIEKMGEEQLHLTKMKLNHAVSPIENPQRISQQRRTVARLKTELRARELNEMKK
jgi:large subunit ribosomal protein L29